MSKTLTKTQERIVALALVGGSLHPQKGEANSVNDLKRKGLVRSDHYLIGRASITDELRRIFFTENKPVFAIQTDGFSNVAVFDHGHHIAACKTEEQAHRVVRALQLLAKTAN
jgi:hypothetical protein